MKRLLTAVWLTAAFAGVCGAQSIVKMPVVQNPLFEVSTDKVEVSMPGDGGGIMLGGNLVITGGSGSYAYSWHTPEGAVLGTESTYYAETPGVYMLDITDSCDCRQTVEFNLASAGIESAEIEGLKIGPNPTDGVIYISGIEVVRVSAVDMSGRLSAVVESNGEALESVDLTSLASGSYVLTLGCADGTTVTHRIIRK